MIRALVLLVLVSAILVNSRYASDIPSPRRSSATNISWVANPDGIISLHTERLLNEMIQEVNQNKSYWRTCKDIVTGYEIAVVLVQDMSLSDTSQKKSEAEKYAKYLHKKWGVGHKDCDNGIVFFLSQRDREMYISTGKGVKQILTNQYLLDIIDSMRSFLRNGEYDIGIEKGVKAICDRLKYQDLCSIEHPNGICPEGECCFEGQCSTNFCKKESNWAAIIILLFVVGAFIFSIAQGCRDKIRRRKDKKRLDELRELLKSKKLRIPTPLCAICLVDFEPESKTNTSEDNEDSEVENKELNTSSDQVRLRKKESKGNQLSKEAKKGNESVETLVCGHQFHAQCIRSWLAVKNTCPICRQDRPRDAPVPSEEDDDKTNKNNSTSIRRQPAMLDDYLLDFAYLRLSAPHYYSSPIPYDPSSSIESDSDSGFGGGGCDGGGGAGGGW